MNTATRYSGGALLALALVVTSSMTSSAQPTPTVPDSKIAAETSVIPTHFPGGLSESEYMALSPDQQLELKIAGEGDASKADFPGLIPQDMVEFANAISKFSDPIFALGREYADVYTRYSVDSDTESITIAVSSEASEARKKEFKARVREILDAYQYPVDFPEKDYTHAAVLAVSDELTTDFKTWASRFGSDLYYSTPDAEGDGVVRVFTAGVPSEAWTKFELRGVTVVVTSEGPDVAQSQGRLTDVPPY